MNVGYLFSVPLAEFRLEQHESLDQKLAELFLARESEGDKYRDPIRRDPACTPSTRRRRTRRKP